jgi:hypothetical protein
LVTFALKFAIAPVAQLDRALPSEGRGQRFESSRVRHFLQTSKTKPNGPNASARALDRLARFLVLLIRHVDHDRYAEIAKVLLNHRLDFVPV